MIVEQLIPMNAPYRYYLDADVAQLVEQLIRNEQVTGSSPAIGSISYLLHRTCAIIYSI